MLYRSFFLLQFVSLCLLTCFPFSAVYASTSVTLHIQYQDINVEFAEQQNIAAHFSQVLDTDINVQTVIAPGSSIRVTTSELIEKGWVRSKYQLPALPGFAKFTLTNSNNVEPLVGLPNRPYQVRMRTASYALEENRSALPLLLRGRVSALIDYVANTALYTQNNSAVSYEIIQPAQPVYIDFSSQYLLREFELAVQIQSPAVAALPFLIETDQNVAAGGLSIDWYMINKFFDSDSNTLIPSSEDKHATHWWSEHLTEAELTIHSSSSSGAFKALTTQPNVCVLNVYKTPEREQSAVFSLPSVYYLDFRLYALASFDSTRLFRQSEKFNSVDFDYMLANNRDLLIGYSDFTRRILNQYVDDIEQDKRFINMEGFSGERIMALIKRKRIDVLIEFPNRLKESRLKLEDNTRLFSYALTDQPKPFAAFIACSPSEIGQEVITSVNTLMTNANMAAKLASVYSLGMTESEVQLMKEVFAQNVSQTQGNN